ncbi:Wzz/FepE/Etk N-terminal domain-containing protein [Polycyclovorans algicola]|uniref:Wzz/FepE/Etk N-terminal domain-containing protein n=1 Tax=Polycyclovorans algicola TaxID=616992 RepID=UPI0004A6AF81|nr:Wzz/FepE/Etk N-terminal domain-containing protein [Polycyclovorans algicola]
MNDQQQLAPVHSGYADDEIDLRELVAALWRGKWWIMLFTLLATVLAGVYAFTATPQFKSEATLQLRDDNSSGGMGGQLGGLAALAGVSLGSGGGSDQIYASAYVESRAFIQGFIDTHDVMQHLYADRWDAEAQDWRPETKRFSDEPAPPPTPWHAYSKFMEEVFSIAVDTQTGTQTWAVTWHDPVLAAEWLKALIERANVELNRAVLDEATNNLRYLEGQLQAAGTVEVRQTVASMMESELNQLMMARNAERGTLVVVDPPLEPQAPFKPKKPLILVLGFMLGGMLGVMFVLVKNALRAPR